MVGRLVLDEILVPGADVLASLESQKTNVEGGDLKRPERNVGKMERGSGGGNEKRG